MKNKEQKHSCDESDDENGVSYKRVRKEQMAKNKEYMTSLGLGIK